MMILPEAFAERMNRQLHDELPVFLHALELQPVRGIRMNPAKPFQGMEIYTAAERIPWTEYGYYLPFESNAGATVFHEAGAFYLQEPAAMLPAEVMNVAPGEIILDLCAAPGGKSTQMAQKLHGKGLIVCNEPVPKRASVLSRNLERMGITNSLVINSMPERIPSTWNGIFDGVLADVPCSGEGMFRRDPQTRTEWSPEQAAGCAERQKHILNDAARFVRPGGRIVYSTCTYNPEENEKNIEWFLKTHDDFETEPFSIKGAEGLDGMLLCLPHRMKGEGQFVAKLRRKGQGDRRDLHIPFCPPGHGDMDLMTDQLWFLPKPDARFGETLVYTPETPPLEGVRVLRAGLHLAHVKGKNLIPDHAAALCRIPADGPAVEIESSAVQEYCAGAEIKAEAKGWTVLTYRGLHLGWGKGSGGTVKNHYPKGLRKERIIVNPE